MSTTTDLAGRLDIEARARGMSIDELATAIAARAGEFADRIQTDRIHDDYLVRIRAATAAKKAADEEWHRLVIEAALIGVSRTKVAAAGDVTRQWVGALIRTHIKARNAE